MSEERFCQLHNHSYFSLLDGLSSIKGMVSCASDMGYKSLALTDHGTCAGLYQFQNACKEKGIKPILGMEGYICTDHTLKEKRDDIFHILLLAKNVVGYKNLIRLSSLGNINGFYYKPRIDLKLLEQHKEGLIVSTACCAGEIPRLILSGNEEQAEKLAGQYKEIFKDDFYLEVMLHSYIGDQAQEDREKKLANILYKMGKKLGIKVIATQDSHYTRKEDWEAHDVLLSIQTLSNIKDPNRLSFKSQDFYLKPYEQMKELFGKAPEVLSNTLEIAEKVESGLIVPSEDLLPAFSLPEGFTSEEDYLKALVTNGMKSKGFMGKTEYKERIKMEMNVIIKCKYTKYFLILWDIVNFARRQNLRVGVGRGSCVGSLCLYVLDVTRIDPMKYDLLFERFLNPDRVSPPDVDMDFDYDRREEVYNYIIQKYGADYCCQIGTYNKFKARAVIRSSAKALDIGRDWDLYTEKQKKNPSAKIEMTKNSLDLADMISKRIPFAANMTIELALKKSEDFREAMHKYPKLLEAARKIEGTLSSGGVHPAGIIVCKDPVIEHVPLRNAKGVICSQYDGGEVEKLGLLKYDLLALKTLTVIDKTLKLIKERQPDKLPKDFDIDRIEPNDKKVFDMLSGLNETMNNLGVFQFEAHGISQLLSAIHVDTFEDMIVTNALYRPGPLGAGMHDMYVSYKHGRKKIECLHPKMLEILKDTYGIMAYQEDIMKVSRELAGFTRGQSDTLRKCVTGDTMFVSKTRGWISIDRLLKEGYRDDYFLNMDENGQQKWVKINEIWSSGNHRVNLVKTRTGLEAKLTKNHALMTSNGWKARARLLPSDYLVCARSIEYDGEDKISSNMAIIIAGLITEGYFIERASTFTAFDKNFMKVFCDAFFNEFGKHPTMTAHDRVACIKKEERLKINQHLQYSLSKNKKIPDVMMGMTLESTRKFLSFILMAEGGMTKKSHQFEFSSKSEILANQVKLLLLRFGVNSLLVSRSVKGYDGLYYRLYINDIEDQKKILSELTCYWSEGKISILKECKLRKSNYTMDVFPQSIVKKLTMHYPQVGNHESGTIYNSSISRHRLANMISTINNNYWSEFVNGKHRYDQIKSNKVYSKSIRTYDFFVDDKNNPSLIANGILIHNCVGKKDLELLKKQGRLFIDGCIKNNISEEIAKKIFEQIEFFGGYGFNRSHSCAYSFIAYQTGWLKIYFPLEFMCNLLTSEINNNDKNEKLNMYIAAAERMKIGCSDPDINQSGLEFKIGNILTRSKKQEIGLVKPLTFMKGVGDKAVHSIVQNQPYKNLEEFIAKTDARIVNIRVFNTLVNAGCMKSWGVPAETLIKEYPEIKKRNEKDKKDRQKQDKEKEKLGGKTLFDEFQSTSKINV